MSATVAAICRTFRFVFWLALMSVAKESSAVQRLVAMMMPIATPISRLLATACCRFSALPR